MRDLLQRWTDLTNAKKCDRVLDVEYEIKQSKIHKSVFADCIVWQSEDCKHYCISYIADGSVTTGFYNH